VSAGKQSAWDRPGIKLVNDQLMASLNDRREKATFLAAKAPHSGAWLSALPTAACGLCLDDEARLPYQNNTCINKGAAYSVNTGVVLIR